MNHLKGILLCFAVLGFLAVSSSPALAFDCPNRCKSAQAAIDKAVAALKGLSGQK